MSARQRLQAGLQFAWGLSKGLKRGDFFPRAGRAAPADAPGGSTFALHNGGPLSRATREYAWFSKSHHVVPTAGLDAPLRILHITDLHVRDQGPWLDALCAVLRDHEPPDLLAITGDLITRGFTEPALDQILAALPPARLGRFAVLGNWEYWCGARPGPWHERLAAAGVTVLCNEAQAAGPLWLAGTDDALAGEPVVSPLLEEQGDRPCVLLTHSPALFDEIARPSVALVLAGHSHAGQVRLPLLGAAWVPMGTGRYIAGWYPQRGSWLYVSRGLGWSIAPVRMWCPPELATIELVPA